MQFLCSIWKILHLTEYFYTGTAHGACNNYQVCLSPPQKSLKRQLNRNVYARTIHLSAKRCLFCGSRPQTTAQKAQIIPFIAGEHKTLGFIVTSSLLIRPLTNKYQTDQKYHSTKVANQGQTQFVFFYSIQSITTIPIPPLLIP